LARGEVREAPNGKPSKRSCVRKVELDPRQHAHLDQGYPFDWG
jgi:hypothetical protein